MDEKKIEINYIVNARIPTKKAHGIQIMEMCQAFVINGVDLVLWLPFRFNREKQNPFSFYDISKKFKIKKVFSLDVFWAEKLIGRWSYWVQILSFYFFIFFIFIFKNRKSLIYSRDLFSYVLVFLGYKVIYECHAIPEKRKEVFFAKCKNFHRIVVISDGLRDELLKNGIKEDNIIVAYDGVNLKKFDINISKKEARQKLGIDLNSKLVLYTGHLYDWKGAQVLADSANYIKEASFCFVGGNEKEVEDFMFKNKKLIDKGGIKVFGHRNQKEIPLWLKAADILILPNTGDKKISKTYTSPLKMFEYMASKRPIVASDLPSLRSVLNESNSLLFKAGDSEDLAHKINILSNDLELQSNLSKQAYKDVQRYAWDMRVENILKNI